MAQKILHRPVLHFRLDNKAGFLLGARDMAHCASTWHMRSVLIQSVRRLKADALAAHRSQLGRYHPEPHWSGLPDAFLAHFQTNQELFREVQATTELAE